MNAKPRNYKKFIFARTLKKEQLRVGQEFKSLWKNDQRWKIVAIGDEIIVCQSHNNGVSWDEGIQSYKDTGEWMELCDEDIFLCQEPILSCRKIMELCYDRTH